MEFELDGGGNMRAVAKVGKLTMFGPIVILAIFFHRHLNFPFASTSLTLTLVYSIEPINRNEQLMVAVVC